MIENQKNMDYSQKIWRYMDLAKFFSMLSNNALYFNSPINFEDPFEGLIPRAWLIDYVKQNEQSINKIESQKAQFEKLPEEKKSKEFINALQELSHSINKINYSFIDSINENKSKYGVNCWHISDHESEAMWKLYMASGQGIAIESTIGQLESSIINEESLQIINVDYLSEDDPGPFNGKKEVLAWKRKSFEHEKELRAIVTLKGKEIGKGKLVACNLEQLINKIHISPFAEPYFTEVIQDYCSEKFKKLLIPSKLFDKPDLSIKGLLSYFEQKDRRP